MMFASSMNKYVRWSHVLPLLGVPIKDKPLPAVVTCPICHVRRLHVCEDREFGGQWVDCRSCMVHGDMIELASETWKLDIPATARKLAAAGVIAKDATITAADIEAYQKEYLDRRANLVEFWKAAQSRFVQCDTPTLRSLQRSILGGPPPTSGWFANGGQLVGATDKRTVDTFYNQWFKQRQPDGRGKIGRVVVDGKGWTDMLVFPYYDLPGRICGFMLAGRELRPVQDWVMMRRQNDQFPGPSASHYQDAGATMLSCGLLPPHPQLGDHAFAFTDGALAVQMQLRHLKDSLIQLPLIGTWRDARIETKGIRNWRPPNDVIFWAPQLDVNTIYQARMNGAAISLLELSQTTLIHNATYRQPLELLRSIAAQKSTWAIALRTLLRRVSDERLEEILYEMELPAGDLRDFITGSEPALASRIASRHDNPFYTKQILYGTVGICEQNDCWYLAHGRAQICDAVVRIEQVLQSCSGQRYYRGHIRFKGDVVQFTEQVESIDLNMFKWAKTYLLSQGKGVMTYDTSWGTRSVHVAVKFYEPTPILSADVLGWDTERRRFNFPGYTIQHDGNVTRDAGSLHPPVGMLPSDMLSKADTLLLSDPNDEVLVFWATAACLIHNLTAKPLNHLPVGLLLAGAGAISIGMGVASRLGCRTLRPEVTAGNWHTQKLNTQLAHHNWPAIVAPLTVSTMRGLAAWLETAEAQQAVMAPPYTAAAVLAIRNKWNVVSCYRKLGSLQIVNDAAGNVLPAYLQDIGKRKLQVADKSGNMTLGILYDMAEWFERRCGGNPDVVLKSRKLLAAAGRCSVAAHVGQLFCQVYSEGQFGYEVLGHDPADRVRPSWIHGPADADGPDSIWIPQRAVSDAAEKYGGMSPDVLLVTQALKDDGALLHECDYRSERGWLVSDDWWHAQWREWVQLQTV